MTTIPNEFNATNSIFNTVHGDQHNTYIMSGSPAVAGPSRVAPPPSTPGFNDAPVDLLSMHFTGRQTELTRIAHAFGRPRSQVPLRCVLFGDQGVGKSQLTYEWSKSTFARENTYVVWISATTVEKLDQGFSKILHLIEHPQQFHQEQMVRLTAARRWLEEVDSGNWLLVLDNVLPEALGFLRVHLPRKNGRGRILFTTRTEDVAIALASAAGEQHEIVRVPMLNVQDGVELFLGHFQGTEIDIPFTKSKAIVKSVGCLPLAISHAAAYMKQSRSTVDEMLALYEKNKIHAISWKNSLSEYEHQSVAATFESQLEDLEQNCPNASNLLKVLAYFDPESIPLDMLIDGAASALKSRTSTSLHSLAPASRKAESIVQKINSNELRPGDNKGKGRVDTVPVITLQLDSFLGMVQSPSELRNAITQLQMRGLTAYQDRSCSALRIHDLIQLVVLETTKNSGTHQAWFECAVELAYRAFDQIEDRGSPANWPRCEALAPHIQSLTTRQEISGEAKAKLLDANSRFGFYMRSRGRYGEAEQLLVGVMADEEHLFGSEDQRTLGTMYNLGIVYQDQGRYFDAETLLKRVLQTDEKLYGSQHVRTLDVMYLLASVYKSQRRYAESEELIEKVLKTREKQLGSDHIDTLDTKTMLAGVYRRQKRYGEVEALYKEVLQRLEKKFGPDHVAYARNTNNLAGVYFDQGHYSDAEEQFSRVLRIREKQLGSNHPHTLHTKTNLARVYESQGRYNDAEELSVQALAQREEVLGPSHPSTRRTAQLLARVYDKLGRSDDSARIRRRGDEPC